MGLQLSLLTPVQSNDCRYLTITDSTGVYDVSDNPTGWGSPNTDLDDIDGATASLTLQITVTTSDGTETEYDAIDFYTYNDNTTPSTVDELTFILTPADLIADGVAMGVVDDDFDDGWYEITYSIDHDLTGGTGTTTSFTLVKIVDGIIRTAIYDLVHDIPDIDTMNAGNKYDPHWYEVTYPIYLWSIFQGMLVYPYSGRKNKVIRIMKTLDNLL